MATSSSTPNDLGISHVERSPRDSWQRHRRSATSAAYLDVLASLIEIQQAEIPTPKDGCMTLTTPRQVRFDLSANIVHLPPNLTPEASPAIEKEEFFSEYFMTMEHRPSSADRLSVSLRCPEPPLIDIGSHDSTPATSYSSSGESSSPAYPPTPTTPSSPILTTTYQYHSHPEIATPTTQQMREPSCDSQFQTPTNKPSPTWSVIFLFDHPSSDPVSPSPIVIRAPEIETTTLPDRVEPWNDVLDRIRADQLYRQERNAVDSALDQLLGESARFPASDHVGCQSSQSTRG